MAKRVFVDKFFDYFIIFILGFIDAFNFGLLIIGNFVPMGINGIAVILNYVLGTESGWFTWFSLIANFPLCLLTFIFVDKDFALKTYLYVATLSITYYLLSHYTSIMDYAYHDEHNVILPVIASSVVSGLLYGFAFRRNASAGGMDVVGKLVTHIRPQLNFIWVSFAFSGLVAIASYFIMGNDIKQFILCMIFCFASAFIGNTMLKGTRSALKVEVVTTHSEEISKRIIEELHHTATVTKAEGMYRHSSYDLLLCVVNKDQLYELEQILKQYPDTFAYMTQVSSTIGQFNRPGRNFYGNIKSTDRNKKK